LPWGPPGTQLRFPPIASAMRTLSPPRDPGQVGEWAKSAIKCAFGARCDRSAACNRTPSQDRRATSRHQVDLCERWHLARAPDMFPDGEDSDVLMWWQAVVLGLVEGITEYLPVSSTGHLILTSSLLRLDRPETKDALRAYLIFVQGGAILAVLGLYWPRIVQMTRGLLGRDADGFRLAPNHVVGSVPPAVTGVLLSHTIKAMLFSDWPVLGALAVGGLWMIWLGGSGDHGHDDVAAISWQTALGIGLFQTLALWPGVSRSMVTIAGGM